MKSKKIVSCLGLGFVALLIVTFSCNERKKQDRQGSILNGKQPHVRVALHYRVTPQKLKISIEGPCEIRSLPSRKLLTRLKKLSESAVSVSPSGTGIGKSGFWPVKEILLIPSKDGSLKVGGRKYHGQLHLIRETDDSITIINELPIEKYLAGVLGSEALLSWPSAALQAQAIVARTYALEKLKIREDELFQLRADTSDQSYRGMERETKRAKEIINQTEGIVLTYGWKLFTTYYHSTCGGETCDSKRGLGRPVITPLSGVKCDFCQKSRYYQWSEQFQKSEIERFLNAGGYSIKDIRKIKLLDKGPTGRVSKVQLKHSGGTTTFSGLDFRKRLGANRLRSTRFQVAMNGQNVTFKGRGWGHGVGMCQWGASGMAEAGYTAELILKYYYPGTELMKVY